MYVRMLIGGRAGEVQSVKFHIAKELIAQGRAEEVEFGLDGLPVATKAKTVLTDVSSKSGSGDSHKGASGRPADKASHQTKKRNKK